jgi:hypothetical protein
VAAQRYKLDRWAALVVQSRKGDGAAACVTSYAADRTLVVKITTEENQMRTLIIAVGAALALSACGGGGGEAENTDANMMTDMNAGMTDLNVMDMNAMDANMTMNAADGMNATENAVVNDLTTNTPDANLANGM